jgi:uncharacterized protein YndB with AHSA1/START domain
MASVVNTIVIDGPAAAVFDLSTTARFWPRWHPATRSVGGVTERPYQLGDAVCERGEAAGVAFQVAWTVAEHSRPSRVVLHSETPPARITYVLRPAGGGAVGTEFRRVLEYDPAVFASGLADAPELERYMYDQSQEALVRLKALIEQVLGRETADW